MRSRRAPVGRSLRSPQTWSTSCRPRLTRTPRTTYPPPHYCCPYPCPYCTLTPPLPTVAPTRVPTVHSLPPFPAGTIAWLAETLVRCHALGCAPARSHTKLREACAPAGRARAKSPRLEAAAGGPVHVTAVSATSRLSLPRVLVLTSPHALTSSCPHAPTPSRLHALPPPPPPHSY